MNLSWLSIQASGHLNSKILSVSLLHSLNHGVHIVHRTRLHNLNWLYLLGLHYYYLLQYGANISEQFGFSEHY